MSESRLRGREILCWVLVSVPLAPCAAAIYLFFEWLFFVTKPSPTAGQPLATQLVVLFKSPLPILLPFLGAQVLASVVSLVAYPRLRGIALLPAAVVMGILMLILADNFTYTMFGFGIVRSSEVMRVVYAGLLPVSIAAAGWKLSGWLARVFLRRGVAGAAMLLTAVVACAPVVLRSAPPSQGSILPASPQSRGASSNTRPNIFFLGIDGVDASILSAYGYVRQTSPFLDSIRDETLFFENAFSNATRTHGSLVTLLTGRLPFSTRVTFPPTVLQGEDARRTLPAILKQLGYTTLQLGMRHYADAEDTNVAGFDAANYRWDTLEDVDPGAPPPDEADAFRAAVAERLDDRLGRLFGMPPVGDAFAHVEGRQVVPMWRDERRVATLISYFRQAPEPWFVHLHLLDTHCCEYHPDRTHFSDASTPEINTRDSQIREADENVRKLFEALTTSGRLERTVVVISSDHASMWKLADRVPLMIRFPRAQLSGRVTANVQLADVAPTMVAYLGRETPGWMDGLSLLEPSRLPPGRKIFGASDLKPREGVPGLRFLLDSGPPNYGVSAAMMIAGNQWFELSLLDGSLRSGIVSGHTGKGFARVSDGDARTSLLALLASAGFAVERAVSGR